MTSALVVTPWFPNRPGGRQGNFIYDSAAALARNGLAVGVLVCRPFVPRSLERLRPNWQHGDLEPSAFSEFAQMRRVAYTSIPRNWLWRFTKWRHDRTVVPSLDAMARDLKPSIIHAHTEGEAEIAVRTAKRLRIPSVVTLHGINTGPRYFDNSARCERFRRALRAADRVILVGEPLRLFFRGIAGSDDNFRVVPNGIAVPVRPARERFASASASTSFISISNLNEGKGIDIALQALAAARARGFDNWDYTIVGDGMQRDAWVALAHTLGLADRVRFLGARPHEEVFDLLDAADVFVLPSYREAFGIAYLEAMAAGLLAIGVVGEGPSAFIANAKTGFLVAPRNPVSLTDCLLTIAKERDVMRGIAAAGREHVCRNFTWDHHAQRLIEVYRELLGAENRLCERVGLGT